jgi:hypothetical protein
MAEQRAAAEPQLSLVSAHAPALAAGEDDRLDAIVFSHF